MGYTTDFNGSFKLDRPLDPTRASYIRKFLEMRHMQRDVHVLRQLIEEGVATPNDEPFENEYGIEGAYYVGSVNSDERSAGGTIVDYNRAPVGVPGLWCEWYLTDDNLHIEWSGGEKFYNYDIWLSWLVVHFFKPWGYTLNGQVVWQGEDPYDRGELTAVDNVISSRRF